MSLSEKWKKASTRVKVGAAAGLLVLGGGVAAGCGSASTSQPSQAPKPPSQSQTQKPPAQPAKPAQQQLGSWSGTGNQVTPSFAAPDSGSYIVHWTYSGNVDTLGGDSQPTNFIVDATDQNADAYGLPNDIAATGQGSTQVTGASGQQSFNVEAAGSWTITVTTAP